MHIRRTAIVYLFLTMLSISSQNSIKNDNNKLQQSKDIFVEAYVKPPNKKIQFNITVLEQLTADFQIFISNVEDDNNETNHCTKLQHCVAHGLSNRLSTIVPENGLYETSYDQCTFQARCVYKIHIKTYDDEFDETLIYRTKDCVDGHCACAHKNHLPRPSLKASVKGKMLTVKWEINPVDDEKLPQDVFLEFLNIDIQEIVKCNKSFTTMKDGDIGKSFEHIRYDKLSGDYTKKFDHNVTGECIRINMNVLDTQNCHGPIGTTMVEAFEKSDSINDSNNFKFTFILIIFIVVIVLCSLIMFVVYGYMWWNRRCSIMDQWRGIYNNYPQNRNSTQLVPMIENRLYLMRDSQEDDFYEIPPHAIKEIGREIGKGAFGRVYIARLSEIPGKIPSQIVAIKKLKKCPTPDQFEEFLSEIQTMKRVGRHPNIVRLLGSCKIDKSLMMVMEYVPCGDLLKYLRAVRSKHEASLRLAQQECQLNQNNNNNNITNNNNNSIKNSLSSQTILGPLGKYLDIFHSHSTSSASETSSYITQPDSLPSGIQMFNGASRPSFNETTYTNLTSNPDFTPMMPQLEYIVDSNELHTFAIQIARGMKHLEEKSITHRDLAARNILIDENKNLKISDFGLSRNGIYVNTRNKKVPLRWLSVEAMKDNLYSSKSDVWSFAILLWEIGTLGGFPYPTVQNHELLNFLKSGQRLEKPENCSDTLYELMLQCWATDPEDRPNFSDIYKILDRNRIYIDFNEISPTYVFPPTSEEFKNNNNKCEKHSKE